MHFDHGLIKIVTRATFHGYMFLKTEKRTVILGEYYNTAKSTGLYSGMLIFYSKLYGKMRLAPYAFS